MPTEVIKKIPWREINPNRIRYDEGEAAGYVRECFKVLESAAFNVQNSVTGITSGTTDLTAYFKLAGRNGGQDALGGSGPSTDLLRFFDNRASFLGNTSTGRIDLVGGTTRVRHGAAGNTGNVFEVTNATLSGTWLQVADDGQTSFASSTSGGVVNIAGVAGGTSLSVGTSGTTTVVNHVMGASDYNHRVVGTGALTWRHNTAGNALAGTWDGNFTFQPPTGTTTTVPLTVKGRASQTGNLLNLQTSTPTTVANFSAKGALTIAPADIDAVLLTLTANAGQTANVMEVANFAGTHRDFTIEPGGIVTVGSTAATDSDVRLQVRAPSSQSSGLARNIFQVIRSYNVGGTNLFSSLTVGHDGAVVCGDLLAHGAAVIRLRLNQGSGQSVDMFQVRNTADTANFVAISSTGQLTLGDGTTPSKQLTFTTASSTASTLLTTDWRTVTSRSLIFNMSGASGTAAYTLTFPQTTTARTATFPNATTTLAGLSVNAQTFTRAITISSVAGTEATALTLNIDNDLGASNGIIISDVNAGTVGRWSASDLAIAGGYLFYPGGTVGSGFFGAFSADSLTASRSWTFPNFSGSVMVSGGVASNAGNTAGFIGSNLVVNAPAKSYWQINATLVVTTADANGGPTNTISLTVNWTDVGGAKSFTLVGPRTLTTVGTTQGTMSLQVESLSNITFTVTMTPFAGGATETYAYYVSATRMGATA